MEKKGTRLARRKDKSLKDVQAVFNKFIRLRDSDENGWGRCFTCGKRGYYKEMDAGHFIPSTSTIHRFNPHNVHCQCKRCNMYLRGNLIAYTMRMEKEYGEDFVTHLFNTKSNPLKLSQYDKNLLYDYYHSLSKELEKEKNV